jgi:alkanesulfonate monooxygenase
MNKGLELFGTATVPHSTPPNGYRSWLTELARRAEKYDFAGLLVFYNHLVLDPWTVAGLIMQETTKLTPLVALQPYSIPPFTAAKTISSLTSVYRRRIDLNVVTGAAPEELNQVNEKLSHDQRYERAIEYVTVVRKLLSSAAPLTWHGEYYQFDGLRINSAVVPQLLPRIFVAGSSDASSNLARQVGHVMITYPEPIEMFAANFVHARKNYGLELGVRFGLVARETDGEARAAALKDNPMDRATRLRMLLKRESESVWSRRIAQLASEANIHDEVYWTGLYTPLLVGSYARVADYLSRYVALGVSKLLLAKVDSEEGFQHTRAVLDRLDG